MADVVLPAILLDLAAVGAVADHQQAAGQLVQQALEDPDDVEHPLDGAEVGDVDHHGLALLRPAARAGAVAGPLVAAGIDEVGDDVDLAVDAELLDRGAAQGFRDGGHRVALQDAPAGRLEVVGIVAHQGDVRAVESGHHGQRLRRHDLPRHHRRSGIGDRVVDVHHVQPAVPRHLHHLRGESERVGRIVVEQRIARRHHLVKEEPFIGERQPRRQGIADDVHLVAVVRQRHRQLGGHHARAAVGGVAADADPHRGPPGSNASRSRTASGSGLQNGSPSSAPIS